MFLCSFSHHESPQSCLPLSHGQCRWIRAAVSAGGRISPFRRSLMSSQNLGRGLASRGFGCILFAPAGEAAKKPRGGVRRTGGGDGGRREMGRWSGRGRRVRPRPRPRRGGRSPSRSVRSTTRDDTEILHKSPVESPASTLTFGDHRMEMRGWWRLRRSAMSTGRLSLRVLSKFVSAPPRAACRVCN